MKLLLVGQIILLSACAQIRVNLSELSPKPGASAPPAPSVTDVRVDSFLWGFFTPTKAPSEQAVCGDADLQRLEMRMAATDVLLSSVTLGIYVPHRAKYVCVSRNH